MYSKRTFGAPWRTRLRRGATALVALGVAWSGPVLAARIITIDPPGASTAFAYGVNDAGAVVGSYVDANGVHGFVRAPDGTYTTFNRLRHMTDAISIDRNGQVAGYFRGDKLDHG